MVNLLEADDYLLTNVVLLFLLINFDLQIGTIYGFIAIVDLVAYYLAFDKSVFKLIPLERNPKTRFQSLFIAGGAYVALVFISSFVLTKIPAGPNFTYSQSVFQNIAAVIAQTFSAAPILSGSNYLKIAVWGILISTIETRFFFRTLVQWGVNRAKFTFPSSITSGHFVFMAAFFGALFAVFHLVAKGITNNGALAVTFVFGVVSIGLIVYFKQYIEAAFLHIIWNTTGVMSLLKIGYFSPTAQGFNMEGTFILLGVLVASWLLLFQQLPIPQGAL